jgi:hypothetical protein
VAVKIGSPLAVLRRAFRPSDEAIHQWWPLRLSWRPRGALSFFDWHGWQTGWESAVCGARRVFGQTFHIGALKICLGGPVRLKGEAEGDVDKWCARQAPPNWSAK